MNETGERPNYIWPAMAVLFVALWVFYLAFFGPKVRPPSLEDSGTGEPASYDWTVRDLRDGPANFDKYKGQAVFLNIWATWCGPCIQEMPSIARLAREPGLQGKGIRFVCVSIDDSNEVVRQFLEGRDWPMEFYRADKLPSVFLTEGIPATFLIAPDGRIAAREVGSARWDTPEVIALLQKLAAGAAASPRPQPGDAARAD